jgi:hypothetical protein
MIQEFSSTIFKPALALGNKVRTVILAMISREVDAWVSGTLTSAFPAALKSVSGRDDLCDDLLTDLSSPPRCWQLSAPYVRCRGMRDTVRSALKVGHHGNFK